DDERGHDVAGPQEGVQPRAGEEEEPDVRGGGDADLADDADGDGAQAGPQAAEDEAHHQRLDHQHGQDEAALGPDGPQRADLLPPLQGGHHHGVVDDDQRNHEDDQDGDVEDHARQVDELADDPRRLLPVDGLEGQAVLLALGLDGVD